MKRSRVLYFHKDANEGKLASLEALSSEYRSHLQICIDAMIAANRGSLPRGEYRKFFPPTDRISSNIVLAIHNHANEIVKAWFASTYTRLLKAKIKRLARDGAIDEGAKIQLFTIGKYAVAKPSETVSADAIQRYWTLLLEASRPPQAKPGMGMRLSVHTGRVKILDKKLSIWWLSVSSLTKSKTLRIPLVGNPFLSSPDEVRDGCLVRKDRRGRWRVEVLETKLPDPIPELPGDAPRVGVDVGLNVLAATSNGRLYGEAVKPRFDKLYACVRNLRANRQRQGLTENSPKLGVLEDRLSGLVKTETGRAANQLVNSYPGYRFVIEDLDLRGCRGQKRFAYRALQSSLEKKANVFKVNPAYTSQLCPSCGFVGRKNRSGVKFKCRGCGRVSHADVVGAINLLGRSEDHGVDLDDSPPVVKRVLNQRYLQRRNSFLRPNAHELPACSRRLTTRGSKDTGTASNAEGNQRSLLDP